MKTRREFLKDGAVLAAFSSIAGTLQAATGALAPQSQAGSTPSRVLYDSRFEHSRLFAEHAAGLGLQVSAVDDDMYRLWRRDLQPRLEKNPTPLVGMTTASTFFCLSELAKNQWMKVQFFAEHESIVDGAIQHNLSGPEHILRQARLLSDTRCSWPESMAGIVATCPPQFEKTVTAFMSVATDTSGLGKERLVSWMIMPTNPNRKA